MTYFFKEYVSPKFKTAHNNIIDCFQRCITNRVGEKRDNYMCLTSVDKIIIIKFLK